MRTTTNPESGALATGAEHDPAAGLRAEELRDAFLKGLGANSLALPPVTPDAMRALGVLVRTITEGTMDLLRLRAEAKSSLHAEMTMIDSRAINPLKAAWDADVALQHLFAPQRQDVQDPIGTLAEAYDDLRAHDRDLAAGMQAAVAGLLGRFDPATLEKRLTGEGMLDAWVPASRKARCWDQFVELYGDVCVEAERDFWSLFEEELRAAAKAREPRQTAAGDGGSPIVSPPS